MKKLVLLLFLLLPKLCFALIYTQLPTSGQLNLQSFTITDANSCNIGTIISSGGGSTTCPIFWNGANWIATTLIPGGTGSSTPTSCNGTYTLANGGTSGTIVNGCILGNRQISIMTTTPSSWQPYLLTQSVGSLEIVSPSGSDTSTGTWAQE